MTAIARALNAKDEPEGLFTLERAVGTLTALKDIGMPEASLDQAADVRCKTRIPVWARWIAPRSALYSIMPGTTAHRRGWRA